MKKYLLRFWPLYVGTAMLFLAILSWGNYTMTVIADNISISQRNIIVIDPGHGGEDGGAISCTGLPESQLNLEIALKLNDLCHLLGYETQMIRTTDVSVYTEGKTLAAKKASDLRQRVRIINAIPNSILISIHQNTFSDRQYSGAQVFYAKTAGSKDFAKKLQANFAIMDTRNHRQAKEASGIYLMQYIENTGVLVECGFLSNQEEEAKLKNPNYQKKLCCVIVSALSQYINA